MYRKSSSFVDEEELAMNKTFDNTVDTDAETNVTLDTVNPVVKYEFFLQWKR